MCVFQAIIDQECAMHRKNYNTHRESREFPLSDYSEEEEETEEWRLRLCCDVFIRRFIELLTGSTFMQTGYLQLMFTKPRPFLYMYMHVQLPSPPSTKQNSSTGFMFFVFSLSESNILSRGLEVPTDWMRGSNRTLRPLVEDQPLWSLRELLICSLISCRLSSSSEETITVTGAPSDAKVNRKWMKSPGVVFTKPLRY